MNNSFTIYNASAGAGKTFTLVKEYLVLLLKSSKKDPYKNILAITFTNKAVGEMKSRIIDSLSRFSRSDESMQTDPLLKAVSGETSLSIDQIREKSTILLKSIVHNYAAFEISTIDGFTHRVLRTFARDLGIPMNFEVELETDDILMEAVERLISRAGKDEILTSILIDFTLAKTDDDKSWDISRDLFNISKLLTNENNQQAVEVLKEKKLEDFIAYGKELNKGIENTEKNLKEAANDFFELLQLNDIDPKWFTRESVPKYFEKIRLGDTKVDFTTNWAVNIADAPLYNKSLDQGSKSIMDSVQQKIAEIFFKTKMLFFKVEFLQEIQKNLVQLSLLNEINREVENIKKERNILLISEFNPRISQEVKDQPAPFIYERLGERYRHYFIDEFQDTSTMQWENLIPLISHNLSSGEFSSGLTIVGDAKQSIYRWRGGRAEQLIGLSNKTNPFPIDKKVVNLPDNFRSGSEIVNFNNNFFNFASSVLTYPEYSELFKQSAQYPKKGDFGYVNISFIEAENRADELEIYPVKILEIIRDLDKGGFDRKDICILTRTRKEGIAVAEYLISNSIPVVSNETLLISQSPEVSLIVNILNLSLNSEDELLKLQILDYLTVRFLPEDERHKVISQNLPLQGNSFFHWLKEFNIEFDLEEIKKVSTYEAVEYIIRSIRLVEESDSYLQFFLDFVFETSQKTGNSLLNLLETWDRKKEKLSIVAPEADEAVKIMTIHKSKGLEFPIVIYPFANAEFQETRNDSLWLETGSDKIPLAYVNASKKMLNWDEKSCGAYNNLICQNELDTLNVLYVACTRASQQLYLLSNNHEKPKNTPNIPDLLKEFLSSKGKGFDELNFEFGTKEKVVRVETNRKKSKLPKTFYSSPTENSAVKIVTRSGSLWDSRQQEAIEKGEITHEILARINCVEDKSNAISWAVNNGIIKESDRKEIGDLISGVIEHPELKHFYSTGTKNLNEKDILTIGGKRLRPDRLNISGKKVSIIDYKTGGYVDSHKTQISEYAQILSQMGYEIEKSLLVYTNTPVKIRIV